MKKITIMSDSNESTIADVSQLMANKHLNISSLDYNEVGSSSVISMMVEKYEECFNLLTREGYQVLTEDFVILRGENRPGELAEIAKKLGDNGIKIRSLALVDTGFPDKTESGLLSISTNNNQQVKLIFGDRVVN